jgi:hypothetical protein
MDIKSIAMRESYVTKFAWTFSDGPETLLWNSVVTPNLFATNVLDEIHMTPACHVTLPFKYWRGSMEFRFQIVASNFHKGRLAISYDPYWHETFEYNTQYTHIIDIASDKDVTFKVGWGNEHAYCQTRLPLVNSFPYSTTKLTSANSQYNNGFIAVRVLNDLVAPSATGGTIEINVFAKMCDDFEVAMPLDEFRRYTLSAQAGEELSVQAGDEDPNAEDTPEPSIPVSSEVARVMASPLSPTDMMTRVHFGEEVTSIRQLMKRYTYVTSHAPSGNTSLTRLIKPNFPLYRGYFSDGVNTDSGLAKLNYVHVTPINWFTPNYVTWRGGLRWKYHRICSRQTNQLLAAERFPRITNSYQLSQLNGPGYASLSTIMNFSLNQFSSYWNGGAETDTIVDPCVEVELPFYSQRRFCNARNVNPNTNPCVDAHRVITSWQYAGGAPDPSPPNALDSVRELVSIGEDFSLNFFLSVPIYYNLPTLLPP